MDIKKLLKDKKLYFFDGAMGTQLAELGLEMGGKNNLTNPEKVLYVHRKYIDSGSDFIISNTFGMNRIYMDSHAIDVGLKKVNLAGAEIARQAAGKNNYVMGDISSTGGMLEPYGMYSENQFIDTFMEQAEVLAEGGVDGFIIETMMDMNEALCALKACKKISSLPVVVSMSYNTTKNGGRTLMGNSAADCAKIFEDNGADMLGSNCGDLDPFNTVEIVKAYKSASKLPVLVQPNAGLPQLINDKTVFNMSPVTFSEGLKACVEAGADMVGGCCGTTPDHIRAAAKLLK